MDKSLLEEKLREASCFGDLEALSALLSQDIDVNSKNNVNGWTALHWACKRGNEEVVKILLNYGADVTIQNNKGESPVSLCSNPRILSMFGDNSPPVLNHNETNVKFVPNYIKNAPLNGQVDIGRMRPKHTDLTSMPITALPASQNDDLVLKVRIANSSDPDFIEIEMPKWKLTYNNLLKVCCEELEINESDVDRIRKLPNTRLRKDSDIKRLTDFQALEIVIKPLTSDKTNNCYKSISACKNQTILY